MSRTSARTWFQGLLVGTLLASAGCDHADFAATEVDLTAAALVAVDADLDGVPSDRDCDDWNPHLWSAAHPDGCRGGFDPDAATCDGEAIGLGSTAPAPRRVRHVAPGGSDANDGASPEKAWKTLKYASARLEAGDTLRVAAGLYVDDPIILTRSGTKDAPIRIEGYVPSGTGTPASPTGPRWLGGTDTPQVLADVARGPVLRRSSRLSGSRAPATAISSSANLFPAWVEVSDLQITDYLTGINVGGWRHVRLNRLLLRDLGDSASSAYTGKGVVGYHDSQDTTHVEVRDTIVQNTCVEGLVLRGSCNAIRRALVASWQRTDVGTLPNRANTGYYIMVHGDRNVVEDSRVSRVTGVTMRAGGHGGHGIGVKGCGKDNVFRRNTAKGLSGASFYVRHRGARFNRFTQNSVDGSGIDGPASGYGFNIRDGASDNVTTDSRFEKVTSGVAFWDTTEDEDDSLCSLDATERTTVLKGGTDNFVARTTIRDMTRAAIEFSGYKRRGAMNSGNRFHALTIERGSALPEAKPRLVRVGARNANNALTSSTIRGLSGLASFEVMGAYPPVYDACGLLEGDVNYLVKLSLGLRLDGNTFSESSYIVPTQPVTMNTPQYACNALTNPCSANHTCGSSGLCVPTTGVPTPPLGPCQTSEPFAWQWD